MRTRTIVLKLWGAVVAPAGAALATAERRTATLIRTCRMLAELR